MPPTDEAPYVDDETRGSLTEYLGRVLERATPESMVAGGGSDDATNAFRRRPRNHDTLTDRQEIYQAGGPITEFIDTRAFMTYGTGVEFVTDDDALTDEEGNTVDEWLAAQFDLLDDHFISRGIQTYWAGDAWGEIVETRGGEFSHVELIDPTTVDPTWDEHGEITQLRQVVIDARGQVTTQPLDPDRTAHFYFKRSTGGPLGESLIEQNRTEIERFAANQTQRKNAIRLHGSPHYHVAVGSESQSIPDRLIRRVRDRFSSTNTDEKTNWVTGGDIEISEMDAPGFEGMESITETDIAMLASGFGIPMEWTNFGADGLGSGAPAESRQTKFERQARAEQRRAATQFIEQIVRPVLAEYSPFPRDIHVDLEFGDVVSDQQAVAEWLRDFTDHYTRDQIREKLGDTPLTDEEEQAIEDRLEDESPAPDEGGGLFAATDAPDPLSGNDAEKRAHTDGGTAVDGGGTGNRRALFAAEADALTQEELVWQDVYQKVLWADDGDDRALFEFDPEEVPAFVIDRLNQVLATGAVFDNFETVPAGAASDIQDALLDSLETQHGWSINSLSENLQDAVPDLDGQDARRIARTETQALVNDAREAGYEEQFDMDEAQFHWVGPSDHRTTETCEAIKDRTDGGVTLSELKAILREEAERHGHDPREWTPHISCRHTYTRVVE